MSITVGDRFRVLEPQTVKNRKDRVIANFLPEFEYRVTPQNIGIVAQLIEAGKAESGARLKSPDQNQIQSKASRAVGKMSTKPKAKKG